MWRLCILTFLTGHGGPAEVVGAFSEGDRSKPLCTHVQSGQHMDAGGQSCRAVAVAKSTPAGSFDPYWCYYCLCWTLKYIVSYLSITKVLGVFALLGRDFCTAVSLFVFYLDWVGGRRLASEHGEPCSRDMLASSIYKHVACLCYNHLPSCSLKSPFYGKHCKRVSCQQSCFPPTSFPFVLENQGFEWQITCGLKCCLPLSCVCCCSQTQYLLRVLQYFTKVLSET